MRYVTGTVVGGKVELPPGVFAEGTEVAVVFLEPDEPIELTSEQRAELTVAMEQLDRGEYIDAFEFLEELRTRAQQEK